MNKQQFIKAFADKAQFTQKDAGIAFEAMAETIAEVLNVGFEQAFVLENGEKIKVGSRKNSF